MCPCGPGKLDAANLIEAVNRVAATEGRKIDTMTILRRKTG
jgi:hypothetical protein